MAGGKLPVMIAPSKRKQLSTEEVLEYNPKPKSRSTVRNRYATWRGEQEIPARCAMPACTFNTQPLLWLGQRLPLILDHANGNSLDNRAENLRYLCPNCDSQLSTRGGLNRGRVAEAAEGTYTLLSRDGGTGVDTCISFQRRADRRSRDMPQQ